MVVFCHQNVGQSHNLLIANEFLGNVAEFKHLGSTVTNQNCIYKENNRLNLGNGCYHSVQSLLSSCLLSKNVKVKIYKTVLLPFVLYGCEN
jgi:hypothetical protein